MNNYFPTILVIGAGQLARMMIEASTRLGVKIRVLASDQFESAALICNDVVLGDFKNLKDLIHASNAVESITFDHEHVPLEALSQLEKLEINIRPGITALATSQNKIHMRKTLETIGAPNPNWLATNELAKAKEFFAQEGSDIILKAPQGGYDGKGVWEISKPSDLDDFFKDDSQIWLLEQKVRFKRELAVQVVRSPSNQLVVYSPVETRQKNGICNEVIAPAPDLSDALNIKIQQLGLQVAKELNVVGVFTIELFETLDSNILVNELAMRPHNSGHWSIDGAVTSQFENHLRAILDLPLGSPALKARYTVMANILGGDYADLYRPYLHCLARDPHLRVHLYGKEVKLGRKVGHLNVSGDDWEDLLTRARHAADYFTGTITE